ncbi:MAG: NADH-quinone oxidoreductase subunit J [Pleurocapsa minor HA4230-MV1]|nr:NADH-quinone oxidoreductase subunit J [Pleurocapsa minor HA4230-MV1]
MNLAEGVQIVSLGILGLMMIGTALGVVLLPKIVHSAFLLAGVFISIAGLYILLNADFVAAAQILVYVGAVNVLILFAIMLVNKQEDYVELPGRTLRRAATAVVCFGLFALLGTMVLATPWSLDTTSTPVENTIVALGEHFFSDYLLPFELASVLLLMAMVGAIILARRDLIPEFLVTDDSISTKLTLPERPRELATLSSDRDQQ